MTRNSRPVHYFGKTGVSSVEFKKGLSILMTFKHFLIFSLLIFAAKQSVSQLPEPLVLDTVKPVRKPTLEDRFKAKAKEYESVKSYIDGLIFREQIHASSDKPPVYPTSAGIYSDGQFNSALGGYDQLLVLSRNLKDKKKESEALTAIGDHYAVQGDLDKSVQYYKEALQIKEQLRNKTNIAKASYRLASVLKFKRDYDEALFYYDLAARNASSTKHYSLLALTYSEIGRIKSAQHKFGEAELIFMRKTLPLYTRLGNRQGRISCFENLAKLYEQQKRYSEAKWFFIQANMLGRKIRDNGAIISSLINLAHVKNAIGDHELALRDYKEAEALASVNNDIPKLIEIKSNLGDLYHKLGNAAAAGKLIDEYMQLKETLFNTGN